MIEGKALHGGICINSDDGATRFRGDCDFTCHAPAMRDADPTAHDALCDMNFSRMAKDNILSKSLNTKPGNNT